MRSVLKRRQQLEYENLKHLSYTTRCIKEAIRLYPPVFFFFPEDDAGHESGKIYCSQDIILSVNVFTVHRNPTIWENPTEYSPLGFSPEELNYLGPFDYIPFSASIQNCIGHNFAMKVVVGTLVNHFIPEVDESHLV